MYVITGITGQVGGTVARTLLAAGKNVRAVVRDASRGGEWLRQGCELALADMRDAAALTRAFKGAEAVFVLLPPNFDPSPDFLVSRYIVSTLRSALETAQPAKVVCLSTIGAQASQSNLLRQLSDMEQQLGQLPMPVAFLRAGWFMENSLWDIAPARDEGVLHSFLQPLDKAVPMVATADVGRTAALLLQESWQGVRIVELEGPRRVTPQHLAATLGRLLGRDVQARSVPRDTWEQLFRSQGMHNPLPRMQMLDGFNQGWIDFAGTAVHGTTKLETVLADLIQRQA